MAAGGSMSLSRYRLNLPGRAPGDRSMSLLSAPSGMLDRSNRSSPEVGIPQTCPPSCLWRTQTMSSVLTAAATLLPRWLNDTFLSVRPSRTAPHPRGGTTAEQTMAEPALLSSGGCASLQQYTRAWVAESREKQNLCRTQALPAEQTHPGEPATWQEAGGSPASHWIITLAVCLCSCLKDWSGCVRERTLGSEAALKRSSPEPDHSLC